jgi:nickel-type superoxide dismutase maturation protease
MIGRGLAWSLVGVITVLALRRHLDVVEVRGRSMAPALLPGDRLLVARLGLPRVGDVVLAADPRDPRRELVKRVSALDAAGVALRGDNGSESTDARTFGPMPPSAVRWRVVGRYWPADRIGLVPPVPSGMEPVDMGGEPACTVPEALIAGEPSVVR